MTNLQRQRVRRREFPSYNLSSQSTTNYYARSNCVDRQWQHYYTVPTGLQHNGITLKESVSWTGHIQPTA